MRRISVRKHRRKIGKKRIRIKKHKRKIKRKIKKAMPIPSDVKISEYTKRLYDVDEDNILTSKEMFGQPDNIRRFMWNDKTGDFILGGNVMHSKLLHAHKLSKDDIEKNNKDFDDYTRGIYIKDKNKIYTRPWWKPKTPYDEFDVKDMNLSWKKQKRLASKLKQMGLPEATEVVMDVSNNKLRELEGGMGW